MIYSGYYDNAIRGYNPLQDGIPYGSYALILLQITAWSWIVTLLVEIFDKGYSFGSEFYVSLLFNHQLISLLIY